MRRLSRVPGLIALVAMTFSFGETLWASTCAPGMDMESSAMVMADQAPAEHDRMAESSDADSAERAPADDAGQCPFGPFAASQSCAGLASLPANALAFIAPSPESAPRVVFDEAQHDILFETALFHPPRA